MQKEIAQLHQLDVQNGALQIDGKGPDPFVQFLQGGQVGPVLLQHFVCDCVERALNRAREAGREPHHQAWEVLMLKRLYLAGDAPEMMLFEARVAAQMVAWNYERKRYKASEGIQQQIDEKLAEAIQTLPEIEAGWQLQSLQSATEAIAWEESDDFTLHNPLFWLGDSEKSLYSNWIDGWDRERLWQKNHLLHLLQRPDASPAPLLEAV